MGLDCNKEELFLFQVFRILQKWWEWPELVWLELYDLFCVQNNAVLACPRQQTYSNCSTLA